MASRLVCVRCGADGPLVDGRLCPRCFLETQGPGRVPGSIAVTRCPRCGSVRVQGRWSPGPDDVVDAAVQVLTSALRPWEQVESLEVSGAYIARNPATGSLTLVARLRVRFRGVEGEYEVERAVGLELRNQLCPACFRRAAGAVQAVLQVRGWDGRLRASERRAVEELIASVPNAADAIVEVEERREGVDYKFMDQGVARAIAAKLRSALGARVVESHKVIGRRSDGKPKTRLTISVRLPFFRPGSLALLGDKLVVIESVAGGRVRYREAGTRRRNSMDVEEAWRSLRPLPPEAVEYGLVTAIEPGWIHVQLLGPSMDYLELPRRGTRVEGDVEVGSEVAVVRLGAQNYVIRRDLAGL